jgi:hypothetical protein
MTEFSELKAKTLKKIDIIIGKEKSYRAFILVIRAIINAGRD